MVAGDPALKPGQSGQALAELVMVLPIFMGILLFCACFVRLVTFRLELIRLARETAIGLTRAEPDDDPQALARALAGRSGVLNPLSLTAKLAPATSTAWQVDSSSSFFDGLLDATMGQELTLTYSSPAPRWASAAFARGFAFEEKVTFKSDPWKRPKRKLKRLLSPVNLVIGNKKNKKG
jgi:hypothetical protein